MKQTALSISISMFFLVLGIVSLYQGSNSNFISSADAAVNTTFNISNMLIITGIILVILSGVTAYIQYLIMTKKGK